MNKENKSHFKVIFTEEFSLCLDEIQVFFAEYDNETLEWWYLKEDENIDYIDNLLSENPYIGRSVESGSFKGLRRITYGKSRHKMLNYLIYYAVHETDQYVDVINIVPSRTNRIRVRNK
jgi:plasmid stabilization system protein ParE